MKSAVDNEYAAAGLTADTDRTLIVGDAILWLLDELPDTDAAQTVLVFLDSYLTDGHERALLNLPRKRLSGEKWARSLLNVIEKLKRDKLERDAERTGGRSGVNALKVIKGGAA